MFEIRWSEILLLAIVTLIFIGPKELPDFLRTLGRYAGVAKRHVDDVRAQFTVVMRESELDELRKEFRGIRKSVNTELLGTKTIASAETGPSAVGFQPEVARDGAESEGGTDGMLNAAAPETAAALPPMPKPPGPVVHHHHL